MAQALLANVIVFARTLRAAGISVRAGSIPDAVHALARVGVESKADVRDALRAVFVYRRDDGAHFDSLFDRFWRVWPETPGALPRPMHVPLRAKPNVRLVAPGAASADRGDREELGPDLAVEVRTYSADETWRRKDFATFMAEDVALAKAAMSKLTWSPGFRVTRRWEPGRGGTVDLRRLLRVNARHSGELISIPYRMRRLKPRPLVVICDVSGSMDPYTRMLLLFAHAMARGARRVEVFVFSTRLVRITRQFASERTDEALKAVQRSAVMWSGGTRIGEAIRSFNVEWARRVLSRGPVVLLISDGWDLGDPELLAREIGRLQRSVHRLIWLNPLLGSPGYEPLTRGMQAALPFVDDFLPAHNLASLEALALHLNTLSSQGSMGRSWN
jgi:uncharacterized protein with von Willebrand factor type A (vWA) domain